ncbi:MAG: DUF4174 domain-containing protein, partial [Bacteroidota bacterium]
AAFEERNVVFLRITPEGKSENSEVFMDKATATQYYEHFKPQPGQFELILVGLDGTEKLRRKNTITPPKLITDLIDTMPMRQQEMRRKGGN